MEIRRFVPGEEAALSRLAARTLLEYNSKHTAPEEEPWIPLLVEKYRPEAILGFSETGHTYVLCDGEVLLGMGGVRKTGEDECLIYGLFLTPETIGKGYGAMLFHAAAPGSSPPRRRLAFMKRWATTIWTATASAGRTTGSSIWRSI